MKQVNVKTMRAVPQNGGDMYDCIVIGANCRAVAARKLAEEKGKRVLVMERRPHIETVTIRKMPTAFNS